ncbi:MAG: DNA polymerase III subunit beta [Candidatus Gracilibacteria bacterium]|nr:DNA polymerase III subunit beta [Candidatus Gracilibacteria bacterium]
MKFQCKQSDLSHALDVVAHVIDTNVTLPVLNNILLRAEDGKVYFSATNLEMAVNYWMEAEVMMEGAVTVPAKLLSGYVSLLKDDQLECALGEGLTLAITSAGSKTQIKCIAAEEYPSISPIEELVKIDLPLAIVPESINQVSFASSSTSTRPVLAGVYCEVGKSTLTMVATDSFRLSEKKITLDQPVTGEANCIVPTRAVAELARLCGKVSGIERVEMALGKNQVMFTVGEVQLYSRLIEGNFPNYRQILPDEVKTSTTLYTADLTRAGKRINLFAKENNNKVLFDFQKDSLDLSTPATQVGTEEGELPISLDGEPGQIALNSEFVLDLLAHLGSDQVDIGMNNSTSPAVFRPVDTDDFLHIIMPLKLQ